MKYLLALTLTSLLLVGCDEGDQWSEFSKTHDCKVVYKTKVVYTTSVAIGVNGQIMFVPMTTPSTTSYLCDDGLTYTR